jgi:FkbM family methyltransferase
MRLARDHGPLGLRLAEALTLARRAARRARLSLWISRPAGSATIAVTQLDAWELVTEDFAQAARWHRLSQTEPHDPDFTAFRWFPGEDEVFVDVGANIGISVVSFRLVNPRARVISFEPNVVLEPGLAALAEDDPALEHHMVGLGSTEEALPLYVPCANGRPDFYLGTMDASRFVGKAQVEAMRGLMRMAPQDELGVCRLEVRVRTLDSYDLPPTLLKIDTETWEARVLAGAHHTVTTHLPLVLIEGANRDPEVRAFFDDAAYVFCERVRDQVRIHDGVSAADSGFFLARSRLDEYRARGVLAEG